MDTQDLTEPTPVEVSASRGRALRRAVPRESHAELNTADRRDPAQVLADQIPSRVRELIPLRHERMLASPFSFYRGGAAIMAGDLASCPSTGQTVQLCGDAHLSNFGIFGSPERRVVFDVNDFDETYPGPWEWDVKRLAASLDVAGRQNGYTEKQRNKIVVAAVRRYQEAMATFAGLGNLAVWYASIDVDEIRQQAATLDLDKAATKRMKVNLKKARGKDHLRSMEKLTTIVDGHRRFVADPPLLVPLADLASDRPAAEVVHEVGSLLRHYAASLEHGHRELVRSYDFVDIARKVVGVGSVGTRCWVVLLLGRDHDDPLLLQVKEAQASVLSAHLAARTPRSEGARVVAGQRIMQATSDIFLGAQSAVGLDGQPRDFYVRQLHDWKGSALVDAMEPSTMRAYGQLCGWTLARAHARSGDRIAISAYLGDDDTFAQAIATFAGFYADLNEQDFARFGDAVKKDQFLGQLQEA